MGLMKTTGGMLALATAVLYGSHKTQLYLMDQEVAVAMGDARSNDIMKDAKAVQKVVQTMIDRYGGSYEFIAGDFDMRVIEGHKKEARCGGFAHWFRLKAAEYGFKSEMESEIGYFRTHFYAVLKRDGIELRIEENKKIAMIIPVQNLPNSEDVFIVDAGGVRQISLHSLEPLASSTDASYDEVLVTRAQR